MFLRRALPLAAVVVAASTGCGGSSSETPFPLEPDFRRQPASGAAERQVVFSGRDEDAGAGDEELEPSGERSPAPSTWGGSDEEPQPKLR